MKNRFRSTNNKDMQRINTDVDVLVFESFPSVIYTQHSTVCLDGFRTFASNERINIFHIFSLSVCVRVFFAPSFCCSLIFILFTFVSFAEYHRFEYIPHNCRLAHTIFLANATTSITTVVVVAAAVTADTVRVVLDSSSCIFSFYLLKDSHAHRRSSSRKKLS